MSATQVVLVAILAVAVLAALAAFSIASRRTTPDWRDELDGRALKSDRSKVPAVVGAEVEPLVESVPDLPVEEPATVQVV
jgi:hypothetical protein